MYLTLHDPNLPDTRLCDYVQPAVNKVVLLMKLRDVCKPCNSLLAILIYHSKLPAGVILNTLKAAIQENREMVVGVVGEVLTKQIEEI